MKYAKSIYMGGQPVNASECDHSSSISLGLRCPECQEAVHFVAGHLRGGKTIFDHFAHYPGSDSTCELKVNSTPQEAIEKLKIEARNQRLKIFNKRFFEVFQLGTPATKMSPRKNKGERNAMAIQIRRYWQSYPGLAEQTLDASLRRCLDRSKDARRIEAAVSMGVDPFEAAIVTEDLKQYFSGYSLSLHSEICTEAVSFLENRTGGYALGNVADLATQTGSFLTSSMDIPDIAEFVVDLVAGCQWIEAFKRIQL